MKLVRTVLAHIIHTDNTQSKFERHKELNLGRLAYETGGFNHCATQDTSCLENLMNRANGLSSSHGAGALIDAIHRHHSSRLGPIFWEECVGVYSTRTCGLFYTICDQFQ